MDNLKYYNRLRTVPAEALKTIQAGRLKGMSDINPMWRIKAMTECFGMCGIGWRYAVTKQWTETYGNETKAFCNVDLFVKVDGEWSEAIPGTGGSSVVAMERSGAYVNDEGYKMALTDALSVAMKALGVAADIYFEKGRTDPSTKYCMQEQQVSGTVAATATGQSQTQQFHPSDINEAKGYIARCASKENLVWVMQTYRPLMSNAEFMQAMSARRKELGL